MMLHKNTENTLIKVTVTPPYPVNRFIQATSDMVRYHSETAFADASIISPVFKGTLIFVINPDGTMTITAESTGGQELNVFILEDFILDDLFENTQVTRYAGNNVLACNHFKSDTGQNLYLEMNKPRPIDRLKDIINEGRDSTTPQEEPQKEEQPVQQEETRTETPTVNPMTSMFGNMMDSVIKNNTHKVQAELEKVVDELRKSDIEFERVAGNNTRLREKVQDLRTRLDNLIVTKEPLNVEFRLTPVTTDEKMDEKETELIKRIATLINVNHKYILHKIKDNVFHITLFSDDTIEHELLDELCMTDPSGSFYPLKEENTFEYRGTMEYNLLVQALTRRGFTEKEMDWELEINLTPVDISGDDSKNL